MICHKRANEDACAHLACIKKTGECLKKAGVKVCQMPPAIVSVEKRLRIDLTVCKTFKKSQAVGRVGCYSDSQSSVG